MNRSLLICFVLITIFTHSNIQADIIKSYKLKIGSNEEVEIETRTGYQETKLLYQYKTNPVHELNAVNIKSSTYHENITTNLISNIQTLSFPIRSQFLFNSQEINAFNMLRYVQFCPSIRWDIFRSKLIYLEGLPSFLISNHELIDLIFYVNSIILDNAIYIITASFPNDDNKYNSEEDFNITIQISEKGHFLSMTGISNFGVDFTLTSVAETTQLPSILDFAPAFKSRITKFSR